MAEDMRAGSGDGCGLCTAIRWDNGPWGGSGGRDGGDNPRGGWCSGERSGKTAAEGGAGGRVDKEAEKAEEADDDDDADWERQGAGGSDGTTSAGAGWGEVDASASASELLATSITGIGFSVMTKPLDSFFSGSSPLAGGVSSLTDMAVAAGKGDSSTAMTSSSSSESLLSESPTEERKARSVDSRPGLQEGPSWGIGEASGDDSGWCGEVKAFLT